MVRKLVVAVAAASALLSGNMAHALSVGDINLRSALNQPLNAEIQLLQVRDLDSTEIIPRLASPDDFGRAGIERPFFLTDLSFTPVIGSDGRSYIRVTSSQPVREPFVNFLLEVRWPSGRVLREFTLLIDPPTYQARPVTAPPVTPPAAAAPAPATRSEQPAARPSAPATRPATSATRPAEPGTVTVGANDTLWVLAQRNRPQNASVHQTMLAIQDLNPDAFIDNNINRLRSGQRLQMPDSAQATQRSQAQAVAAVAQQNADWQAARQSTSQRQIDARQRDSAAPAPATIDNGDTLRLVAGSDETASTATDSADGAETADQGALRDQLDQTKEQLDAAEREKAEMGERLADVQGQLETLQRLLELKDAQLAALQQEIGSTPEMPDILPEADAELADVEAEARALDLTAIQTLDDPRTSTAELDGVSDEMTATDAVVDDEAPAAAAPAAETTEVVAADEPTAPAADAAAPAQDAGAEAMLQRLLQNPTVLYTGAGLALIVLLLILMALSRRNARREEEMADNFIAQASREQVDAAEQDDDFNVALADYDEASTGDEEDALVAAEGLIAYGKFDEAHDTLIKALEQQPERSELRLKLMEVEALRENAPGYAEQATALRAEGGHDSPLSALDQRFPAMAAAAAALAGSGALAAETDTELADIDLFSHDEGAEAEAVDELDAEFDLSDLGGDDELANLADSGDNTGSDDLDLDFDLDEDLGDALASDELDADAAGLDLEADDLAAEIGSPLTNDESQADAKADDDAAVLASLDDDFDLSLTDDLQPAEPESKADAADELSLPEDDDLMLDWSLDDAESSAEETPAAAPETLETARADEPDEGFSLSDDELLDFESEFNAAMSEDDASASLDADQTGESAADDLEATPEQPEAVDTEATREEAADMDASMGDDDFDFLSGTDETATKLDLARAYVEMGDQEGARDILNEVVDEGNEQQQQEARSLLEQLDS